MDNQKLSARLSALATEAEFCANADAIAQAFATHREAAAKAERDRLLTVLRQCASGSAFMEALVAKFEAALESKP